MGKRRVHAFVRGRVQGVFFRKYTCLKGEELGLDGWVRNLPDQTVETVFEGDEEIVAEMLSWLSFGSPGSLVTSVDSFEMEPVNADQGFRVRY